MVITFHKATRVSTPISLLRESMVLPLSKTNVTVDKEGFITSLDIERVDFARDKTTDGAYIDGFFFTLTGDGAKKLAQAIGNSMGNLIVVRLISQDKDKPMDILIGARPVFKPDYTNQFFVISEYKVSSDHEMHKFVQELNDSISLARDIKAEEKNNIWGGR